MRTRRGLALLALSLIIAATAASCSGRTRPLATTVDDMLRRGDWMAAQREIDDALPRLIDEGRWGEVDELTTVLGRSEVEEADLETLCEGVVDEAVTTDLSLSGTTWQEWLAERDRVGQVQKTCLILGLA